MLGDDESRDVPVSRVSLKMDESKDGRGRRREEERKRERRGVGQNRGGSSQTRLKGQGEL